MQVQFFSKLNDSIAAIRTEVFIQEQGFVNEFDSLDKRSLHCLLYRNGVPAATGRIYRDENVNALFHIGRIATLQQFRRSGCGREILRHMEEKIKELGGNQITLSSQCRVQGFYESCGYIPQGAVYYDEFCPHIRMIKNLKTSTK